MTSIKVSSIKRASTSRSPNKGLGFNAVALLVWIGILSASQQAMAHHPLGNRTPSNFIEGFASGLAHPIIGLDHLAFVVAVGLMSAGLVRGFLVPGAFVLASLVGTGLHLLSLDLPGLEIIIAGSVVAFGGLLLASKTLSLPILAGLAAVAGIFHGYAYGEAIIGARMAPLLAYLLGFSIIQYGVAMLALWLGRVAIAKFANKPFPVMQVLGFAICSVGVMFLTSALVG
ncbi:MAG: HupE/UreJ family protein [Coleofasciculus sp. S288]|nr:HupE/UreJ family protein [Coleofasciculus sp. S288]